MRSLLEFLENQRSSKSTELVLRKSSHDVANILESSGSVTLSTSNSKKVSEDLVQFAQSNEVMTTLSTQLGTPKDNESEDEFVARAKMTMKNILLSKLGSVK